MSKKRADKQVVFRVLWLVMSVLILNYILRMQCAIKTVYGEKKIKKRGQFRLMYNDQKWQDSFVGRGEKDGS